MNLVSVHVEANFILENLVADTTFYFLVVMDFASAVVELFFILQNIMSHSVSFYDHGLGDCGCKELHHSGKSCGKFDIPLLPIALCAYYGSVYS